MTRQYRITAIHDRTLFNAQDFINERVTVSRRLHCTYTDPWQCANVTLLSGPRRGQSFSINGVQLQLLKRPHPEPVCHCPTYSFPHRLCGGACTGNWYFDQLIATQKCDGCQYLRTYDEPATNFHSDDCVLGIGSKRWLTTCPELTATAPTKEPQP